MDLLLTHQSCLFSNSSTSGHVFSSNPTATCQQLIFLMTFFIHLNVVFHTFHKLVLNTCYSSYKNHRSISRLNFQKVASPMELEPFLLNRNYKQFPSPWQMTSNARNVTLQALAEYRVREFLHFAIYANVNIYAQHDLFRLGHTRTAETVEDRTCMRFWTVFSKS